MPCISCLNGMIYNGFHLPISKFQDNLNLYLVKILSSIKYGENEELNTICTILSDIKCSRLNTDHICNTLLVYVA